jgi:CRISPR-associated protein (TIGR03986 family)
MPWAYAPYNFVPLANPVYKPDAPCVDWSTVAGVDGELVSGWVDVEIETLTPLYIRNALHGDRPMPDNPNAAIWEEHFAPTAHEGGPPANGWREPFNHGDPNRPVIPGSSLRGLLAQSVAIVSDAALRTAPDQPITFRAIFDSTTAVGHRYRERFVGHQPSLPHHGPIRYPEYRAGDHGDHYENHFAVLGGLLAKDPASGHWKILPTSSTTCPNGFVRIPVEVPPGPNGIASVWVHPEHYGAHGHGQVQLEYQGATLPDEIPDWPHAPNGQGWVRALRVATGYGHDNHHLDPAVLIDPVQPPVGAAEWLEVPEALRHAYLEDLAASSGGILPARSFADGDLPTVPSVNGLLQRIETATADDAQALRPCFYLQDVNGNVRGLGATLFFRVQYNYSPAQLTGDVPEDDLVTRLFGRIGKGEQPSRRGRLRFEDAPVVAAVADGERHPIDEDEPVTSLVDEGYWMPHPLLGPKPSAVQMYLRYPYLQYSYPEDGKTLPTYDDPDARLRGFKLYRHGIAWDAHRESPPASPDEAEKKGLVLTIRTVVRPVRVGVVFRGRIHFHQVTPVELGALVVAIDLDGNTSRAHRLGMGGPIGLGSVRIRRVGAGIVNWKERLKAFIDGQALSEGLQSQNPARNSLGRAVEAFYLALVKNRSSGNLSEQEATELKHAFWDAARMQDLLYLLKYDAADLSDLGAPDIDRPQWKERRPLRRTGVLRHDLGTTETDQS